MIPCRSDVFKLVQDLHSIGIVHGDLEPRNIVRTHGGGFLLIDFSESRKHVCKESKVQYMDTLVFLVANTEIGQRTPHSSRPKSRSEVYRTANIAKIVTETTASSS
jgi:tRNA A-37 threonylcarbamoyl transferase component Bud32